MRAGKLNAELAALAPERRAAHGGQPECQWRHVVARFTHAGFSRLHAVDVPRPGVAGIGDTREAAKFLRDVMKLNSSPRNFRLFGPDETVSNGFEAVFETSQRQWMAETSTDDEYLARSGQVMEVLSEHQCEGWLEGYLLTGRHGLFNCYEAFIHIVDSMFNQHAKWLKVTADFRGGVRLPRSIIC